MEENKVVEATESVEQTKENPQERPQRTPRNGQRKNDKRGFKGPRKPIVKEYEERVVKINRVTKVVKGGKRMKFSALVVIGNKKGKYGFGTGKSGEVPDAIKKAVEAAKKDTRTLYLTKENSITHEVFGKFGASTVFLKPAPEGTGIIAGGPVRSVLELAGVQNVYSKVYGSRTSINVVRATVEALKSLKNYNQVQALRNGGSEDAQ